MPQSIKLSTDQMRLISLFQNVTKATARDCVEDEKQDKIIFVVQEGKMGLAIGKGGSNIKSLKNIITNGKIKYGFKQTVKSIENKQSKFVICSSSISDLQFTQLNDICTQFSVPVFQIPDNSILTGKILHKSFRISAFSIINANNSDIDQLKNTF